MIASLKQRAPTTRVASALSDGQSAASLASFGDIAHKVQSAVATALSGASDQTASIRVAVADRQPISGVPGELEQTSQLPDSPPLPPRRPTLQEFAALEPARLSSAYLQLISGAQPILGQQFVRTVASN